MSNRYGQMVWQGKRIVWQYQGFKDKHTLEIDPHFNITAYDMKGNYINWPHVTVDLAELKGITDLAKWPQELLYKVLDNICLKMDDKEPALTRLEVPQ